MQYKPLHCWDCGTQVIFGQQGRYELGANLQQVKFRLADGSYCESPFCVSCAQNEWTWDRVKAFESAVNRVHPLHHITVVSMEGPAPTINPIIAVLEPPQAIQVNRS